MTQITVDVTTDELSAVLEDLYRQLGDLTPLMRDIGDEMLESTRRNFDAGTAPDGTPWAPRSQATLDRYDWLVSKGRLGGYGATPLTRTGTMRAQIAYEADPLGVSWGSNAVQAAVMQFGQPKGASGSMANGSPIPWGDIPAREYLGVGPDDETAITEIIEDYLDELATG